MLSRKSVIFGFQAIAILGMSTGCFEPPPSGDAAPGIQSGGAARCITPEEAERMADQALQLVNLERAERDLPPVVVNPALTKIAEDYACRMIDVGFFGHEDPISGHSSMERAVAAKYLFYAIGENLAAGPETPADVMKAWMESDPHRDVILDPSWREVGIAVRSGGEYSIYWVQEFGDPADF